MPEFSTRSRARLATCHEDLQRVFARVVQQFDCTILCGHRDQEAQNEAFHTGKSKKPWPTGKHNRDPSMAVDVMPWPIDWNDRERATYFAGYVKGVAEGMGVELRWGGDWDGDWSVRDNVFDDLGHFELVH